MIALKPYEREKALAYARKYALSRNPLFFNFSGLGGDCTNFVSQCILAGSCTMNYTPDFGWYYKSPEDRAPAFTGVPYFWLYMTGDPEYVKAGADTGPIGKQTMLDEMMVGDVIQLGDRKGDYYHTLFVSGFSEEGTLVAAHSNDVFDRPLSSYDYSILRCLHLEGVRIQIPDNTCFKGLIDGTSLPSGAQNSSRS